MQEGWECKKCHNIMAPNTPFCLFCWFQSQQIQTSITIPTTIESITEKNILKDLSEQKPEQEAKPPPSKLQSIKQECSNIKVNHIDITIPLLNKEPIYPLSEKWPDTKIFLSSIAHSKERAINRTFKIPYILDSIMDFPVKPSKLVYKYFDYIKAKNSEFLLDSGAFTLMRNKHKQFNLDELLSKYCFYINEFDIQNFFELDLDELMPIKEVEELRKKIYLETHKMPILVWHKERSQEYWTRMCKENDFIAIGGMAHRNSQKIAIDINFYQTMVDEAHTYNTKVHGLGFTPLESLNAGTIFFDTVDSTSWVGGRHGISFSLENGKLKKIPLRDIFASDSSEKDLEVWAKFCENYHGTIRI